MQPRSMTLIVRALIGLQLVATVALLVASFAAIATEQAPVLPAILLLGSVGLMVLATYSQLRNRGVLLFGLSALVFACGYYVCLDVLDMYLAPLLAVLLGYAVVILASGLWLMWHVKPAT